jgi:hypothetical protein
MCTLSRGRKVIVGILLLLFIINCHFFVTTEVVNYNTTLEGVPQCDAVDKYQTLVRDVWPWVDAIIYSFLPFVVILTLKARRGMGDLSGSLPVPNKMLANPTGKHAPNKYKSFARGTHHEGSTKITIMLLTISFTFLVTTLPMNISSIVSALAGSHASNSHEASKYKLARTITELLMYTNHSINFFLYLLTGQKFRQQLKILLCRSIHRPPQWGGSYYSQVNRNKTKCDMKTNGVGQHLDLPNEMTMVTDDRLSVRSSSW